MRSPHRTVLRDETLAALAPRAGGRYADLTLGFAGHAEAILEASGPDGRLLGFDRDPNALAFAGERLAIFGERVQLVHERFGALQQILALRGEAAEPLRLDGLVADLGVSSPQLDEPERGFSFREDGPLDMRMDPTRGETAKELIERLSEAALADVIYTLGEERRSRPIARNLKQQAAEGRLETTGDLRRAVWRVYGGRRGRIDPATRTFQALRIAVNGELDELDALLEALPRVLADGGVAAIISFHSLEDRAVKHAFKGSAELRPLTKKPVVASEAERDANPRARSAKLRAARRLPRSGQEAQP
ncbi:MAG: 16S rRNA (cytosine(1402)-N(4))-methyltransferase RsmH [Myxococcota bacterium]